MDTFLSTILLRPSLCRVSMQKLRNKLFSSMSSISSNNFITIIPRRYFCTGMYEQHDYHHYALNVPLYTHFTSPIRRYPDILVHRLLDMAVRERRPEWSPVEVGRIIAKNICTELNIIFVPRSSAPPSTATTSGWRPSGWARPRRSSSWRCSCPRAAPSPGRGSLPGSWTTR